MDKAKLLARYERNLSNSNNKAHYLRMAKQFLDNCRGPGRRSIEAYIASLRERYKPGTVNLHFRVIRRLYAVNGMEWEFTRGEAPVIKELDEYRPQLGLDIIEQMICRAKTGKLYPSQQTFIALSTIYGLRREEMANIRAKDVNLRKSSIYIATVKSGRERYHLIPPEIKPIIAAHDFDQVYPLGTLSVMFKRIIVMSGYRELRRVRLGWHTVRRSLLTGLVDAGVNVLAAKAFLRWRGGEGDTAMPARYYGNVVITSQDSEPVLQTAKGDEAIFEKHPFLSFWR